MEARILLSADPLTGLFDAPEQIEPLLLDDTDTLAAELVAELDPEQRGPLLNPHGDAQPPLAYSKPVQSFLHLLLSTHQDQSSWQRYDVVGAHNISFEPVGPQHGRFEAEFNFQSFLTINYGADINALHYVSQTVTAAGVNLQVGDILFSISGNTTFMGSDSQEVSVHDHDVALFRPDTQGDYSSGVFALLLDDIFPAGNDIEALTLVEQDTTLGGATVAAGDLLMVVDNGAYSNYIQRVSGTSGVGPGISSAPLIASDGVNISRIAGMELLETAQTLGGVSFSAGSLLVADHTTGGQEGELRAYDFTGQGGAPTLGGATDTFLWSFDTLLNEPNNHFDALATISELVEVNFSPTGGVSIDGVALEDQILSANVANLADEDGLGSLNYQWLRDGNEIANGNLSSYQLGDLDVDSFITLQVSYTDGYGTWEEVLSNATAAVANTNDSPGGSVLLVGSAQEDQSLTGTTGSITDVDGLGVFSYQWRRDGLAIDGAQTISYTPGDDDVGAQLTLHISYVDGQGTQEQLLSAPTAVVEGINDAPLGTLAIDGLAREDQLLSADTSALHDHDGLGVFGYQWLRDGSDIAGATAATYLLSDADVGVSIGLRLSYTDDQGFSELLVAVATASVVNIDDAPEGEVVIVADDPTGQVLRVDTSALSDADGLGDFSFQWLRNGEPISAANQAHYSLVAEDDGAQLAVLVSFVDGQGKLESVLSQAAAVSSPVPPEPGAAAPRAELAPAVATATPPAAEPQVLLPANESAQGSANSPVVPVIQPAQLPQVTDIVLPASERIAVVEPHLVVAFETPSMASQAPDILPVSAAWQATQWLSTAMPQDQHNSGLGWLNTALEPLVWVASPALLQGFDCLRQELLDLSLQEQLLRAGSATLSVGLSVGYAAWLLRSGVLFSTAMSALPAWRMIDPLQILVSRGGHRGDDESLQSMVAERRVPRSEQSPGSESTPGAKPKLSA